MVLFPSFGLIPNFLYMIAKGPLAIGNIRHSQVISKKKSLFTKSLTQSSMEASDWPGLDHVPGDGGVGEQDIITG